MRLQLIASSVLVVAALGCGPSAAEIKRARQAQYSCSYEKVFDVAARTASEQQPPLEMVDPGTGVVISAFRWHDESGLRKKAGAAMVDSDDKQFNINLKIENTAQGFRVVVIPRVLTHVTGSPQGKELSRDDADWPAWADVKADKLQMAIFERLGDCVVAETTSTPE